MRWDRLFADLEAQYDAATTAELAGEIADRSRREFALVQLAARIRAADGEVQVAVRGGEPIRGTVLACGPDWMLLAVDEAEMLVPLAAVSWIRGLPSAADTTDSLVTAKLTLGYALRGIARDRAETTVTLTSGERVTGTLDRVGADFVELAEHPLGEPRRASAVRSTRTMPMGALAVLRRH